MYLQNFRNVILLQTMNYNLSMSKIFSYIHNSVENMPEFIIIYMNFFFKVAWKMYI